MTKLHDDKAQTSDTNVSPIRKRAPSALVWNSEYLTTRLLRACEQQAEGREPRWLDALDWCQRLDVQLRRERAEIAALRAENAELRTKHAQAVAILSEIEDDMAEEIRQAE